MIIMDCRDMILLCVEIEDVDVLGWGLEVEEGGDEVVAEGAVAADYEDGFYRWGGEFMDFLFLYC